MNEQNRFSRWKFERKFIKRPTHKSISTSPPHSFLFLFHYPTRWDDIINVCFSLVNLDVVTNAIPIQKWFLKIDAILFQMRLSFFHFLNVWIRKWNAIAYTHKNCDNVIYVENLHCLPYKVTEQFQFNRNE